MSKKGNRIIDPKGGIGDRNGKDHMSQWNGGLYGGLDYPATAQRKESRGTLQSALLDLSNVRFTQLKCSISGIFCTENRGDRVCRAS